MPSLFGDAAGESTQSFFLHVLQRDLAHCAAKPSVAPARARVDAA
jgi:hypothetical protein